MTEDYFKCGVCGREGNNETINNHSCFPTNKSTITIKGYDVEYHFEDDDDDAQREMNDGDIDHVGRLLGEGYIEGELNQYDPHLKEDINGWWHKV